MTNKKKTKKKKAPASLPDPSTLATEYERKAGDRKARLTNELREEILPRLKKMGVKVVAVEYSGYGDSGAINSIDYFDAKNKAVDVHATWPACGPMIENVVYEYLPAGFENNEGGQGSFTIDVESKTLTLEHGENYTETEDSCEEHAL
jgi:hypothetical protein